MTSQDINNITCSQFAEMPDAEQLAFVIGVANGRGMTSGLFRAYAGAAQDFAATQEERNAIQAGFETIYSMLLPLLEIDVASLLNGTRVACRRPELRDEFVINALATVHLNVAKALKQQRGEAAG